MPKNRLFLLLSLLTLFTVLTLPTFLMAAAEGASSQSSVSEKVELLIGPPGGYGDESQMGLLELLTHRVKTHPFHLYSFLMFACAIAHTFFTNKIRNYAHRIEEKEQGVMSELKSIMPEELVTSRSFKVEILHFLGEVEVVFGIWVAPLILGIMFFQDWETSVAYLESRNFIEPFFVIIIMTIAATRPIVNFAEQGLKKIASLGGKTPGAWWLTILIVGPLLGSLITEPGAITVSALLLSRQFYYLNPTPRLKYATLGLLFCNISVGGVLTHFAAPPVLMVAGPWGWDSWFMLTHFGWKATIGIFIATSTYYWVFRKEFADLAKRAVDAQIKNATGEVSKTIPIWITFFHLALLVWVVFHAHHPIIVMGGFFTFLGFYQATAPYQAQFTLRPALLVGFFLASLVIHGGLQGWWISPLLSGVGELALMGIGVVLTAFNDNAAVTYLTTLIKDFSPEQQYAIVAGAVAGGGLTVIANAPNPAGQSLLHYHFDGGISPWNLFLAAFFPTTIMALCFAML